MDAVTEQTESTHQGWQVPQWIIPRLISLLLVGSAVVFTFLLTLPEVTARALNDEVLHLLLLKQTIAAMSRGHDFTDFWVMPNVWGYLANAPQGVIVSEQSQLNTYTAEVTTLTSAIVMLKATYHPGMRALVDGRPVPTMMLMPSYLGVSVEPGDHTVEFVYQPPPYRRALQILGMIVLVAAAGIDWWQHREKEGFSRN